MPKTKTKKSKINNLHMLFIAQLKVLLDIETQLVKALPKMAKNATDKDLRAAFEEHLEETKGHAEKVAVCLESLGEKAKPMESEAIRGLIADAEWCFKNIEEGPTLDACLISAAQSVEHFEMASYGSASEWAKLMGQKKEETILREILDQEKIADQKLNDLAMNKINSQVDMGMEEQEEE